MTTNVHGVRLANKLQTSCVSNFLASTITTLRSLGRHSRSVKCATGRPGKTPLSSDDEGIVKIMADLDLFIVVPTCTHVHPPPASQGLLTKMVQPTDSQTSRIILDTDLAMGEGANIDDGFALALAHADPKLHLDMITTVHGNTDVESATILTGVLASQLDIPHTPIFRGAASAILHTDWKRQPASHVLAMQGTCSRRPPCRIYAANAIIEHVLANPGQITIVAIGPLTNIALALLLEPRIVSEVKEVVIMGGLFDGSTGSRSKPGETNVFADPEAAQAVLRSGLPQRWIGLDCTLKVRLTKEHARALEKSQSEFARFAGRSATAYIDLQKNRFPGRPPSDSCPIHDALAVAVVSHPDLCQYRHAAVTVITGEGSGRGMMIVDRLEGPDPPKPNCRIAIDVDTKRFKDHFYTLLESL